MESTRHDDERGPQAASVASAPADDALGALLRAEISAAGGWIGFERYMALALYAPGLGYYSRGDRQFGWMPSSGSDFVTAPEMSPLFGRALARQVAQALAATGTREVWEFGAGTGKLAAQLLATLDELGAAPERYTIVDLSGALRERQARTLAERVPALAGRVQWASELPEQLSGVVVGNEVLDAMPVALLHWDGAQWWERGVTLAADSADTADSANTPRYAWADRPTDLRPPVEGPFLPGTVTEVGRHAAGFIATLGARLQRGAAFFIDYGYPEREYYLPQRHNGTLMCHRAHQSDANPLADTGRKDITAHVDFTAAAVAAQDAGLEVLGYTSQGRFLFNCGFIDDLRAADIPGQTMAMRLVNEHEMGEIFKVLGLAAAATPFDAIGFAEGDRTHTL